MNLFTRMQPWPRHDLRMRQVVTAMAEITLLVLSAGLLLLSPKLGGYNSDVPRLVGRAWAHATSPNLKQCPHNGQSFWLGCTDVATAPPGSAASGGEPR
jgi:hypothetical protein